jgi:hypothetical protein
MPTEPQPLTMFEAVRRAVEVCDDGTENGLDELLDKFEDDDEPISAIDDVEERLNAKIGPPEFDDDDGDAPMTMARAVIAYLHYRRDEADAPPVELLRLAARAEFDGKPPDYVARWLELQGVSE